MTISFALRRSSNALARAGLRLAGAGLIAGAIAPQPTAAACQDYAGGQGGNVPPVEISTLPVGELESFGLSGDRVWLVSSIYGGLTGFDISDPQLPTGLGSVAFADEAFSIAIDGDLACITYLNWSADAGIKVVDLSDPMAPVVRGGLVTNAYGPTYGVAMAGGFAYLAMYSGGLGVVDLSDPHVPTLLGHASPTVHALGVAVSGSHAYVAERGIGLRIFDISDPADPWLVGSHTTADDAHDVFVVGGVAYVAASTALEIVDVANPAFPTLLGTHPTVGLARAVHVRGSMAYVAVNDRGVRFVDVSSSTAPVLVAALDTPGFTHKVVPTGEHILISDQNLLILPDQCSTATAAVAPVAAAAPRLQASPNPFNPTTVLHVRVVTPGPASLRIFTIDGRLVRTLEDGWRDAGMYDVHWDGHDDRGRPTASGGYIARLVTNGEVATTRLSCIR